MNYFVLESKNEVNPNNTVIDRICFNYSFKNKNPLEHVRCYNKHATNHAFKLEKDQVNICRRNYSVHGTLRILHDFKIIAKAKFEEKKKRAH